MFSKGYSEGLTEKDQSLMQKNFEDDQAEHEAENKHLKRVSKVNDNVKFGRNRSHIADLFRK